MCSAWRRRGGTGNLYCLLLLVVCSQVTAEVALDARAIGFGGQLVSTPHGAIGLFDNPSTVARLDEAVFSYDFSQTALAFTLPLQIRIDRKSKFSLGTIGIGITDLVSYDRFFVASLNNPIGTQIWGDNQLVLTLARAVGSRAQIGFNIGVRQHLYLSSDRPDEVLRDLSIPYGVGVMIQPHTRVSVGLAYHHLDLNSVNDYRANLAPIDSENLLSLGQTQTEFANLQVGAVYHLRQPDLIDQHLHLRIRNSLDIRTLGPNDWRWRTGVEFGMYGLWLRSGLVTQLVGTSPTPQSKTSWRIGASVERGYTAIHYAYQHDTNDYQHFLSLNFSLGEFIRQNLVSPLHPTRQPLNRVTSPDSPTDQTDPRYSADSSTGKITTAEQIANKNRIEVEYLIALVKTESSFKADAVSGSGAAGLTQLMPLTARDLGLKVPTYSDFRSPITDPKVDQRFDAERNLEAGAKYLRQMLNRYDGNYALALAAYNAGPGRVQKNIPLIRETERYVGKVLSAYYQYQANPELKSADLRKLNQLVRQK